MPGTQPPECECGHLRLGSQQGNPSFFYPYSSCEVVAVGAECGDRMGSDWLGHIHWASHKVWWVSCWCLYHPFFIRLLHSIPSAPSQLLSLLLCQGLLCLQFTTFYLPHPCAFASGPPFLALPRGPGEIPGGSSAMEFPVGRCASTLSSHKVDQPVTYSLVWPRAHETEQLVIHQNGQRVLISASLSGHVTQAALSSTHISILLWFCG